MVDSVDWAAGLFEGEGTIVVKPYGEGTVSLQLASIDKDTVDRFQAVMGGKVYGPYGPYQPRRKPHWRWDANGKEAGRVLKVLAPRLGMRRGAKAQEALARLGFTNE